MFENTEDSYIDEKISKKLSQPKIAFVKKVVEHSEEDDFSNFECDVITAGDRQQLRDVAVMTPGTGLIEVPRIDDTVLVSKIDGRGERHVIIGTLHTRSNRAPLAKEGMLRYRKGNLYFEMDGDGDTIRLAHKDNDDDSASEANSAIEIDSTGDTPSVNVKADKITLSDTEENVAVEIDSTSSSPIVNIEGGTINLGDPSGDLKKVARKGDAVEVDDPESGTISGTITSGSSNVKST